MGRDVKTFYIFVNAFALLLVILLAFIIRSNGMDSTEETSMAYGLTGWFEVYNKWGFPNGKWGINNTGFQIHFQWLILEYFISLIVGFIMVLPFIKVIENSLKTKITK